MLFRFRTALLAAAVTAAAAGPALATTDSTHTLDIGQVIGADTFYNQGYTGTDAIIANIEGGYVWNGQQSLTQVTTDFSAPSITGQFDRHATWVGSLINGQGTTTLATGIAYGATLWSGAIAASWDNPGAGNYSGGFTSTQQSFSSPYLTAMVTGINGKTADVINSSWNIAAGQDGNEYHAVFLDSLIDSTGKLVVLSAGNGGTANTIYAPASGINSFVVGALQSDISTPPYSSIATFSSRSPSSLFVPTGPGAFGITPGSDVANARAGIDITAPGTDLELAFYGGTTGGNSYGTEISGDDLYQKGLAGTSFAAPIVASGAALLVDAGKTLFLTDVHAIDGRILKAVLMNSATRPAGWNNGQSNVAGVITTTQALDDTYGAGILNLSAAYSQYTAGTTDLPSLTGGTAKPVGWAFGQITHGATTAHDDYLMDTPITAGSTLAATLNWFANDSTDSSGNPVYGSFDNLDLQVWLTADGLPVSLVAQSDSLYESTEELDFAVPTDGTYMIRVAENGYLWNFNGDTTTAFGLAWSVSENVPEPGSLALLVAGSVLFLRRHRFNRQTAWAV